MATDSTGAGIGWARRLGGERLTRAWAIDIPWRVALGWGSGSLGLTVASYAFTVLLLRFMTDSLAIAAGLAGALIAASKLVDAVVDPVVGSLSDRTRSRMGRRRPWMLLGSVLLAAGIALVFNVPATADYGVRVSLVALGLLLYSLGYATFAVPWLAMPAEMTDGYHTRTVLFSTRVAFNASGQALASLAGPFLLAAIGESQSGYARVGWLMAALILIPGILSVRFTRDARATVRDTAPRGTWLGQTRSLLGNRPYVLMLTMKALLFLALSIWGGSLPYLTKHVMQASDTYLGTFFLIATLGMLVSQPLWVRVSRQLGKTRAFHAALWIYAALLCTFWWVGPEWPATVLFVQAFAVGAVSGGTFLLTQALLPDTIEYDYCRTGLRREGVLSGFYAFVEKTGAAFGIAALGLLLGLHGYAGDEAVDAEARRGISLCASVIPAVGALLAGLVMLGYRLSEADLARARADRARIQTLGKSA